MNELFVNVKVDREERPDVDAVYMDAVQAMTGRGGWPMTVFMTPDREPFYGGTYFPKDGFLKLMDAIDDVFRNKPDDVRQNVGALVKAIDSTAQLQPAKNGPGLEQLNHALQSLGRGFDADWGGFGQAPKFPSTFQLDLMLRAVHDQRRRRPQADHLHHARRHVLGRDVRPHRWRLRPLLDRSRMARPALREDVVRPGLAARHLSRAARWCSDNRSGVRSSRRRSSTSSPCCAIPTVASTRPRTPTRSIRPAPASRAGTPRGLRPKYAPRSPIVPSATVEQLIEWYGITEEGNFEGRSIPHRLTARGQLRSFARTRRGPATVSSPPARSDRVRASTTRCSPSGTHCSCRR